MCTCSKRRKTKWKTALLFHGKTLAILPLLFRKAGSYLWTWCSFSLSILGHLRFKALELYLVNYTPRGSVAWHPEKRLRRRLGAPLLHCYKWNTLQIQVNYFPIASQMLNVHVTFFFRNSDKIEEYFRFWNWRRIGMTFVFLKIWEWIYGRHVNL